MVKCGEEDLDGMDGDHGLVGEEVTPIHSVEDSHGYQEDGGECHIMDCHTTCRIHITAIHGYHGGE